MPRWDEEAALRLLTPLEWKHLAQLAHDLGWQAEEALEETLDEEVEVPVSQDVVFPRARAELDQLSLLAAVRQERPVLRVFEYNYWLGWRASESGANTHTYIEAPGVPERDSSY